MLYDCMDFIHRALQVRPAVKSHTSGVRCSIVCPKQPSLQCSASDCPCRQHAMACMSHIALCTVARNRLDLIVQRRCQQSGALHAITCMQ